MQRLTFTFDNGPWLGATEEILAFLADRAIKATFFVVGERLRDPLARKLTERAKSDGHWIGNHTLTHGRPLGVDGGRERVAREIGEAQRLIGELAHPLKLFRPNGGGMLGPHLLSPEALSYLVDARFTVVTWNNVPGDWMEPRSAWVHRALTELARSSWSVLVLHDQHVAAMIDTLERFHDATVQMGVEIAQDFPADCLPIREGEIRGSVENLVALDGTGGFPSLTSAGARP